MCKAKGLHVLQSTENLDINYESSALRIKPFRSSKISTNIHYNIFKGGILGMKNLSRLKSIIRTLLRGLPRILGLITRYAKRYPIDSQRISVYEKSFTRLLKDFSALLTKQPSYENIFARLEELKKEGMIFTDSVMAFNDNFDNQQTSTSRLNKYIQIFERSMNRIYALNLEGDVAKAVEIDDGVSVSYTGEICIYQLCFDNSDITIHDVLTECRGCQHNLGASPKSFIYISATSLHLKQLGSSEIRMPASTSTKIKLSKDKRVNIPGTIDINFIGEVAFLGNAYSVPIKINTTHVSFQILNVSIGAYQDLFDVKAISEFNLATTWNSLRFKYSGKPSAHSNIKEKITKASDHVILTNSLSTSKRIIDAKQDLKNAKERLVAYNKDLITLEKDYNSKKLLFQKAESDYKTNETRYLATKAEYRGYFTLDILKQISTNLSLICDYQECQDTCHTMPLYDICQDPKIVQAEEMRCIQERITDRTTVLEAFSNLCDLTKQNYKTIYTGTCQAGKQAKLQKSLIGIGAGVGSLAGGPIGAAIGTAIGFVASLFSSCDTSYETLKQVTNYQVKCTQKRSTTRTKIFYISKCLPYPIDVLSEYKTPYRCLLSNTTCVLIADGACIQHNNNCRKRRDFGRRTLLETMAVYNDSWNRLDFYEKKLEGLHLKKQKSSRVMIEAKRLMERLKAVIDAEELKTKFAQQSIDNILVTLSLEKCFLDFHQHVSRNSSILKFSNIHFKADVGSRENILLEMIIDGDDRRGHKSESFLLNIYDNDEGISFERGVRKIVQNYVCQRHSKRRRRAITERISITPLARHDELRDINLPDNVTDNNIVCLHVKTVFGYLEYVLFDLESAAKEKDEEVQELKHKLKRAEVALRNLEFYKTDEIVNGQIEVLKAMYGAGQDVLMKQSSLKETVITSWKLNMEIYTKSNNFTACLNFEDCFATAVNNLAEFPNAVAVSRRKYIEEIEEFRKMQSSIVSSVGLSQILTLVQSARIKLQAIKRNTVFCESPPTPKLLSPYMIDAFKGEKLILRCKSNSKLRVQFMWKKDGLVLPFETEDHISIYINENSVGQYRCVVWNMVGNGTTNATLIVLRRKPYILSHPENLTFIYDVNKISVPSFVCNVSADPLPVIKWYFQPFNQVASLKLPTTKPVLTIRNPRMSNAGYYYCFAGNQFGNIYSQKARLDVLSAKLSQQEISISFDMSLGNVNTVNKTAYQEELREASSLSRNQQFEMDVVPSDTQKVKFEVKLEDNDTTLAQNADNNDIKLISKVANTRFTLSERVGRVVSRLEYKKGKKLATEMKNSIILGFNGNRCTKGSHLHSNGFTCGKQMFRCID